MTRWARAVAAAALCALALTGCTTFTTLSEPGLAGPRFHLAQIGGGPVTEDRRIGVDRVSTPPDSGYEWTVASVDPASRRLQLFYTDGACTTADRLHVQETATTVVIGISASKHFDGTCVAVGIPRTTTLTLRHPLGGRALMEGATGINDGLPTVSDPATLPDPDCSTDSNGADAPVGMPDATTRMAPAAVAQVFVCRTWWPKGSAHTSSTTVSGASEVAALVRAVNAGVQSPRSAAAPRAFCTKSRGSWYNLTFQGAHVRVEVKTDEINCHTITNGSLAGTMTPALERTLDALFPS